MHALPRTIVAAALAIAFAAPGAASAQFTNSYFFGDSLSDAGSFKPVLPPGTGLFTTNPGPVWVTPFSEYYGLSVSPANQGGNDYAQGGARVTLLPGYPPVPPISGAVPIATQITQFLAKGPVDPKAIYSVQGGGNDLFTQLDLLVAGQINVMQLQANVTLAAAQLGQAIAALQAGGARNIIVWNLPDAGSTPSGRDSGFGPLITSVTQLFNTTLFSTLNALGGQTIRLNEFALLNEVIANPQAFGFVNVTQRACGATPSLLCTSANLVTPDAAQTFLFADGVHSTTAGQAVIAQYAISVLNAPLQIGVLAEAPLAVEQANWRALDGRMMSAIGAPRSPGKIEAWAAYDYDAPDYSTGFFTGNGNVNTIAVGGDVKVSDNLLVGLMFNYSENKSDYGGASFKLREPMGTVYAAWADGPWYLTASAGGGSLDFDTTRNVQLGAFTRPESGNTNGWQAFGRVSGGYWFRPGDWVHGPMIKLTYQEIRVRQFTENASNSTSMTFGQQERTSFITGLGWQVAGQFGAIRPFARASWEYESQDDNRTVTANVVGMGSSFNTQVGKPDNSWGLFTVGAAADFGKVTGFLTGTATAGKGDGDYYAITVGLRVPL